MILTFILSIIFSAAISFFFTPLVKKYFENHHWVENPLQKNIKTHNATAISTVPRGGGLPIFLAILITSLIFLPLDRHLFGILLAALITLIVGLFDDVKDVNPSLRLITNITAAFIVAASGIGIAYLSNPFGGVINLSGYSPAINVFGTIHHPWLIADFFALIWIVWCMNIVGWSAGVEGQLPGFVAISAIFIGILGLTHSQDISQWPVIILAGAIAGSYLGFLPFNFYPQSIMPGYSGKSLAGFFLAVLAILSGAKVATVILVLGIPMIDALFVLTYRLARHRSLFQPNDIHLHHRLLKLGWTRPQIAIFYWLISLVLGLISLFLNSQQKLYVFLGLFIVFVGSLINLWRRT